MARQTCDVCGLTYRYEIDFEEHQSLGCRIESATGDTWSEKDTEEEPEGERPEGAA